MSNDSLFDPNDDSDSLPNNPFSGDSKSPMPAKGPASPFEETPFQKGSEIREAGGASFTILHVLCWTAGIGVAMSVDSSGTVPPMGDPTMAKFMGVYMTLTRVISAIGFGPMVGMLPFWLIYRWQGVSFPYHPGHWLMMHYGIAFLVTAVGNWVQRLTGTMPNLQDLEGVENPLMFMGPTYISATVASFAGVLVAATACYALRRDRLVWRITFGVLVLQSFFGGLATIVLLVGIYSGEELVFVGMGLVGLLSGVVGLAFIVSLIVAVVMDFVEKNRRDWLHWMPFVLLLVSIVASLGSIIVAIAMLA